MDLNERLDRNLAIFDKLDLDDPYERRVAVKPLIDFYQLLILEVGVTSCHLLRDTMNNYSLNSRWNAVKHYLELIEKNPSEWDQTISSIQKIRGRNEHNDDYIPNSQTLRDVREKAPQFREYLLSAGEEYLSQSLGLSTIDQYKRLTHEYSFRSDSIRGQYGATIPKSTEEDPSAEFEIDEHLVILRDEILVRLPQLNSIHDLEGDDLNQLIALAREVERIEARESVYLRFGRCPKCGKNIIESRQQIGGSPEEPPDAVYYRLGCGICDFVVFDEIIEI